MARYRPDEFHQSMLIPVSLEEQLMPGTLEYAIHTLIDQEVDTGVFDRKYRNVSVR